MGAVIETDTGTRFLIDTPPELRIQLIANGIDRVDAVLFTHDHADHTHGLDDVRAVSVRRDGPLPMYGAAATLEALARKFPYVFDENMRPLPGTSKPEGRAVALAPGEPALIGDATVLPIPVPHGHSVVFGYRIGPIAYITDAKRIPAEARSAMAGVKVLVLNALFRTEHPTHMSVPEAIRTAEEMHVERTYLTHLTHDNFHADLEAELPRGIAPAFDGLTVRVD